MLTAPPKRHTLLKLTNTGTGLVWANREALYPGEVAWADMWPRFYGLPVITRRQVLPGEAIPVGLSLPIRQDGGRYRLASCVPASEVESAVSPTQAAELCAGLTEDADKVVAIHNYIASHFTYDDGFAAQVAAGQVVNYTPDAARTLETRTGICYDFSALFAAMCRSQGIPCAIATGYLSDAYHAWDMVYVDGDWVAVDMTRSISSHNTASQTLAECVTSLDGYTLAAS